MDYILDIIIPKKEIGVVKLSEKLVTWGDSVYSRTPPQYITDSGIVFEQIEDTEYYSKLLGEKLTKDTIVLNLKSHLLFELEYAINNDKNTLEKNELLSFLSELFNLSEFYILLVREDEKVKERYRITFKEEIRVRLADSLKWSEPKDVLLFKKNAGDKYD